MTDPNQPLLEEAAAKLAPFLEEIVFVGGVTLGLLITDQAAAPIRPTNDVDIIAQILTYIDYMAFSKRLKAQGFTEDMGDDGEPPVTCRWRNKRLKLDVLALDKQVLGYTNRWYRSAMQNAVAITLPSGKSIRVIMAPHFLGTKMEAFRTRGKGDFAASHDLEDFIAIIEGRPSLLEEIQAGPTELRSYLSAAAATLLAESQFLDVLPGFVLDQGRVPIVLNRLQVIASASHED